MKRGINTAVILAAGLGSRLGNLKEDRPKGFLQVGDESLIERSIRLLKKNGISDIIVGTGYGSHYFDQLRDSYNEISTLKNPIFADSGSMYTLYLLRQKISGPFLLLESDLLYEEDALHQLLKDKKDDIILASDATQSGDEVYVQSSKDRLLQKMSKESAELDYISGELVGISKLSERTLTKMMGYVCSAFDQGNFHVHYEDALVGISQESQLFVKVIKDLAWCEIDDADHLKRATSVVLPKMITRD